MRLTIDFLKVGYKQAKRPVAIVFASLALISVAFLSCEKPTTVALANDSVKGGVIQFYTSSDTTMAIYGKINIYYKKNDSGVEYPLVLTQAYTQGIPGYKQDKVLASVTNISAGDVITWRAESDPSYKTYLFHNWDTHTIAVNSDGIMNVDLGGGTVGKKYTQATFWAADDAISNNSNFIATYGTVKIYVDNVYKGTISYSFSSYPGCGGDGGLTVDVTPDVKHTWYAVSERGAEWNTDQSATLLIGIGNCVPMGLR